MEDGNPISGVVIILTLILFNAIISTAKAALSNVNENVIRKKAESGDKRSITLLKILESSGAYMTGLELLINGIQVVIGLIFFTYYLDPIEAIVKNSGFNINIVRPLYLIVFTILLVLVCTLFGTVIPSKLAIKDAQRVSYGVVDLVLLLGSILKPFTWVIEKLMYMFLLLFRIKPSDLEEKVTEDEIIYMVNEGQERGVFDAGEAEMISNIIELDEKEAQDIMTPKKKIIAINSEMKIEEALRFMLSENYSRYPLYEENRDNIIGILHLKDVINAYISDDSKDKQLKDIAREPYFVPDTQNINILFHDMQEKNIHMAIVIDEYGQTAGLVAMEDFLEEIVGNIQDEYDNEEKMILSMEESSVVVKGSISLEDLEDELDIAIEHDDFETLNGLLIALLDRIPQDGERATLDYEEYRFDILETRNKMIEQVRITKIEPTKSEEATEIDEK